MHFGLCPQHFRLTNPGHSVQWHNDSEDLAAALLPELSEFKSAIRLDRFLARLLVVVTKAAFHRAAPPSLSYITNQLIHSSRHGP